MNESAWIGVAGVVVGAISLLVAVLAKRDSKASREIAERGEQTGLKANELSRDSNRIAVEARDFAEEANTVAKRADARDQEVHLVSWELRWPEAGECRLVNIGQHEALDVTAAISVDGEKREVSANPVSAGASVTLSYSRLRDELTAHQAEVEAQDARYEQAINAGNWATVGPAIDIPLKFNVVGEVWWKTPLGTSRSHRFEDRGCFCLD